MVRGEIERAREREREREAIIAFVSAALLAQRGARSEAPSKLLASSGEAMGGKAKGEATGRAKCTVTVEVCQNLLKAHVKDLKEEHKYMTTDMECVVKNYREVLLSFAAMTPRLNESLVKKAAMELRRGPARSRCSQSDCARPSPIARRKRTRPPADPSCHRRSR